jgi:hypothetical protein
MIYVKNKKRQTSQNCREAATNPNHPPLQHQKRPEAILMVSATSVVLKKNASTQ